VRGGDDPRLGKIDAVLLSDVHFDHLGDVYQPAANAGECGKPDLLVKATPESVTVVVVVAKKAKLVIGGEQNYFFRPKIKAAGGDPSQVQLVRFGGETKVGDVKITTVPAVHTNGLDPKFIEGSLSEELAANGLTAYVGPPASFVVRFTNGLVAYLSGDTGITAEQDIVVHRYYKANFAVMNIGGTFTTGPVEAAYVINNMVKPNSVIASHANEAATKGGKLLPNTKTVLFEKTVKVPVYIPLSGKTMEFNGKGKCVAGC
jgi:L-ascorbate metabolism protein UlaG (beta-lactamase superfamily)